MAPAAHAAAATKWPLENAGVVAARRASAATMIGATSMRRRTAAPTGSATIAPSGRHPCQLHVSNGEFTFGPRPS